MIHGYFRWVFWNIVYMFRRLPDNEIDMLGYLIRTNRPGVMFRPHVYQTPRTWVVWLKYGSPFYQKEQSVDLYVMRGGDGDKIIGFVITDDQLEAASENEV